MLVNHCVEFQWLFCVQGYDRLNREWKQVDWEANADWNNVLRQ